MDYIDREVLLNDIEKNVLVSARKGEVTGEMRGARKVINRIMRAKRRETSPCDLCRYDPPSSMDGKPCSLCPASPKEQQVKSINCLGGIIE